MAELDARGGARRGDRLMRTYLLIALALALLSLGWLLSATEVVVGDGAREHRLPLGKVGLLLSWRARP